MKGIGKELRGGIKRGAVEEFKGVMGALRGAGGGVMRVLRGHQGGVKGDTCCCCCCDC